MKRIAKLLLCLAALVTLLAVSGAAADHPVNPNQRLVHSINRSLRRRSRGMTYAEGAFTVVTEPALGQSGEWILAIDETDLAEHGGVAECGVYLLSQMSDGKPDGVSEGEYAVCWLIEAYECGQMIRSAPFVAPGSYVLYATRDARGRHGLQR